MAASLVRTARAFGVSEAGIRLVSRAHALAMAPRVEALADDHHPLYLHPGRPVLVLLRDADVTDPVVLAATAVTESEDEAFRLSGTAVREALGTEVAQLQGAVPLAGSERLAEDLVSAAVEVRLVALAERLDHLRHAHLREADDAWRRAVHAEAGAVWLPVAERTHPRLAQRYRNWHQAFARRLG